ncbi:MAG TPA: NnrS family protein [Alphaproteobacteria bacterium]
MSRTPSQFGGFNVEAWLAVFGYGFRPFFLLAGLAALTLMAAWVAVGFGTAWSFDLSPAAWHGHEMLFGFVAAAVAGFLLTAVPSWTGSPALSGAPLAALAALWLAGRIASLPQFAGSLPAALVDLSFFPVLGAMLAAPLLRAGKLRNTVFLLLLLVLTSGNLLVRLEWLGMMTDTAGAGVALTVGIVLLMVTVIGGRIVPAFTQNALRRIDPSFAIPPRPVLDRVTILLTLLLIPADLAMPETLALGALAAAAALIHAVRLAGWGGLRTLHDPLLWILHLGYGWIPVALALKAAALLLGAPFGSGWLHALTAGAFSTMILAVMTRAALGHTGRELRAAPATVLAYLLLALAAALRAVAAVLPAAAYLPALVLAGIAWAAAFALFLAVYLPILTQPRPDGRPG